MKKVAGSGRKKREKSLYELDLIKSITDMGKPDGTPYGERSVLTYTDNLYSFSKQFLGKAEVWNNLKWLEDTTKVETKMSVARTHQGYLYSLFTKMAMYNAIVVSLKAKGYVYDDKDEGNLVKIYTDRRNQFGEEAKMISVNPVDNHHDTKVGDNQKQVLLDIKPKDILTMVDKMNVNSFKDGTLINRKLFMIATMFKIHSEFPFRNDVADVKVILPKTYEKIVKEGNDKEFNWLIISKEYTFILNKFKTQNKYKSIIAKVEDKSVKSQLKKWIAYGMPDDFDNQYLFTNDGKPLTRNHISVLLSNESDKRTKKEKDGSGGTPIYVGMKVSTTLLAKIFNETPDNYKTMTDEEKATMSKMAGLRGHSLFTHFTLYRNTAL